METFETCLKFLSADYSERIGLIGGEPTLHPNLKQILARLIDSPFSSVCLFTNGIILQPYFNELRNGKFQILINLNDPRKVGSDRYAQIMDNIDQMVNHLYMRDQVGLGLNLYDPNMDFTFILEALERFRFKKLRVSVAVPNLDQNRGVNPLAYFRMMKPAVRDLVIKLLEIDVAPWFDCNYIPYCLEEPEDRELREKYAKTMQRSNLFQRNPICSPVMDILPDMKVVRCFGMSDACKVNLMDFKNTQELRRHFQIEVDALAYQILPDEECRTCRHYAVGNCSCGCYAYRMQAWKKLHNTIHFIQEQA